MFHIFFLFRINGRHYYIGCLNKNYFNILATDPTQKKRVIEEKKKKKDGGFKTAPDGRLIITDDASGDDEGDDEPKPSGDIDSDTDDTGIVFFIYFF